VLGASSGQAEPARIASGEAAGPRSILISYFGHECEEHSVATRLPWTFTKSSMYGDEREAAASRPHSTAGFARNLYGEWPQNCQPITRGSLPVKACTDY